MKSKRQSQLLQFIEKGLVSSQTEATRLLKKAGFKITQTTVSRDLEEIGAIKIKVGKDYKYGIPKKGSEYGMSFKQVCSDFIISKALSSNILVLKTPPGHAGVVAAAIDRNIVMLNSGKIKILGCVAGDDTVFVCLNASGYSDKQIAAVFSEN